MSSQLFDAQLLIPDNHASCKQLSDLVAAGNFTGRGLPNVAHKYLDAFCNRSYSSGRRRWVGIALVKMMRASTSVIQRLKQLSRGLSQIGVTMLHREETEDCRLIAGLIIRQGLEAGIDFAAFWASSKLLDSAPNFPQTSSDIWISQFQKYMDILNDLLLTGHSSDAVVVYPIALFFKNGFKWTGRSSIAIVEKNVLTVLVSNSELSQFQIIDIPLGHITDTILQQDSPHESQEGRSGHEMHTLVLKLHCSSPNYQFNSSDCTTSGFRMSFALQGDADYFQAGLEEARKNLVIIANNEAKASGTMHAQKDGNLKLPDTHSMELLHDVAQSVESRRKEPPVQHLSQGNDRGKLPKVSKAMKQKAVQTQQVPFKAPKGTKARVAKSAAAVIEASGDEGESEESSQDEYDLDRKPQSRSSGTFRKSRRRTSVDDEEFVPNKSKAKVTTYKRTRRSSDAAEQYRPTKKRAQARGSNAAEPVAIETTSKKQKTSVKGTVVSAPERDREPISQSGPQQTIQSEASTRHSLIGGLLNSKSPSRTTAPTFKKPGHPASTPGRPRTKPLRSTPIPQTPHDGQKNNEDLPVCSASTPRSQSIHDEDFGIGNTPVNAEILSSNTKRVPDSPHAESTAISGHADQDDVHREKCRGDLETAKSDPFQGREDQRMTTFTRKLTAEGSVKNGAGHVTLSPLPTEPHNDDVETDDLKVTSTSQPLLKQSPSFLKSSTQPHIGSRAYHATTQIKDFEDASVQTANAQKVDITTVDGTSRWLARGARALQNNSRIQRHTATMDKSSPVTNSAIRKENRTAAAPMDKQTGCNDHTLPAPQEATEDTRVDPPLQEAHEVGLEGDTTLVDEEEDMPEHYAVNSHDLQFRSSPPLPDSSSVRDASSDEYQSEPEPSPPTSRADGIDWEDALQPHQRDLHEQLLRTSKRVTRHIIDNETAVTDIADVFANDGERLLDLHLERQNNESTEVFHNLTYKKRDLLKELSNASKNLKQQRRQLRAAE